MISKYRHYNKENLTLIRLFNYILGSYIYTLIKAKPAWCLGLVEKWRVYFRELSIKPAIFSAIYSKPAIFRHLDKTCHFCRHLH